MDKIAETKREIRLKAWAQMYAEYQESGNTVTAWCEERGLSVKTFYYRLRKVREVALEQTEKHRIVPIVSQPINMLSSEPSSIKISSNGIMVELSENVSAETITTILRGLREC